MVDMISYPDSDPLNHDMDTSGLSDIPFGKAIRKEFLLRNGIAFLNHGSYGTVPRRVLDMQHAYNIEREVHPDLWFRLNAEIYVDRTRKDIAARMNADIEELLLVENATEGMNVVIKSFAFQKGDAILDTTLTYGAIQNLAKDVTSRIHPDVERVYLPLTLPIESEDDVVRRFEQAFEQHPNIKVAIIDHITSPTAILLPVKRLTQLCHSKGVLAVIDGAHCFGQIQLDMKDIGADTYVSNLHKWNYTPRGCAALWIAKKHLDWVRPSNTSWMMGGALNKQFFNQGTKDHVPYICGRHGIEFYDAIGGMDKIVSYTSKLAKEAKELLCQELGLEALPIPESMEAPNMKNIKLPLLPEYPVSLENVYRLHRAIFGEGSVFTILIRVNGCFYVRLSTQIYTDMEDIKALMELLRSFIENNK